MNKDIKLSLGQQIGTRIRMARIGKHYTIKELADVIGVSTSLIAMIEYGERVTSKIMIMQLCETLNIFENWLMYGHDRKARLSATPIYRKTPISSDRVLQKAGLIRDALRNAATAKPPKLPVRKKKNESESGGIEAPIRTRRRSRLPNESGTKLEG
jgi:transcriptional regulator with XRE-family HTH domain